LEAARAVQGAVFKSFQAAASLTLAEHFLLQVAKEQQAAAELSRFVHQMLAMTVFQASWFSAQGPQATEIAVVLQLVLDLRPMVAREPFHLRWAAAPAVLVEKSTLLRAAVCFTREVY
jgi:hypothetical protein